MTELRGANNRIVAGGQVTTWAELETLSMPPVSAVFGHGHDTAARAVWTHLAGGNETLIAAASRIDEALTDDLLSHGFAVLTPDESGDLVTRESPSPAAAEPGRVWLLTSGSTGRPKRVAHTLETLTTVTTDQPARTWLCPYTPGAYAWWQVVSLSLTLPNQHVVFVEPDELGSWPTAALEHGVTAASGTPTFWRQALFNSGETMQQLQLEQITLGGEPVDQSILDRLRELYPKARVSWIYASSEAGAAIAVHDGLAGFPEAWLDRDAPDRPRLSVDGDELLIASKWQAAGMGEQLRTGDRVEIRDGRVHIVGRLASDEINVGGSKASAATVRAVLLDHPGVAWAAVRGRKAPLVGTMVVAEVVLEPGAEVTDSELVSWCSERLSDYAVPRRIRILSEIPIKETLKSDV